MLLQANTSSTVKSYNSQKLHSKVGKIVAFPFRAADKGRSNIHQQVCSTYLNYYLRHDMSCTCTKKSECSFFLVSTPDLSCWLNAWCSSGSKVSHQRFQWTKKGDIQSRNHFLIIFIPIFPADLANSELEATQRYGHIQSITIDMTCTC